MLFLFVCLNCQTLVHLGAPEEPRELEALLQVVQVGGQDTCHWGPQGDEGASWEACPPAAGRQRAERTAYALALADPVPLVLSVLGGGGSWGGGPSGETQDALQHLVEALRGGEEVLCGVVGVLRGEQ